jgi:hypothetical protein
MMKRLLITMGIVTAAILLVPLSAASASGLTVSGAKLVAAVAPGDSLVHRINVAIGRADSPVDIEVGVSAMLQAADGTPHPSAIDGACSAVDFIMLDRDSFHLNPGETGAVNVSLRIPEDVGDGGRYALITVAARAAEGRGLNVITGVDVPVYISIKGSHLIRQGSFSSLEASAKDGHAIAAAATIENTGNHDFKFRSIFAVTDGEGRTVGEADTGLSLWTLIPGMSRSVHASVTPQSEVPPGVYRMSARVCLEDGSIIAEEVADFELATELRPQAPASDARQTKGGPGGGSPQPDLAPQDSQDAPAANRNSGVAAQGSAGGVVASSGAATGSGIWQFAGWAACLAVGLLAGSLLLVHRKTHPAGDSPQVDERPRN